MGDRLVTVDMGRKKGDLLCPFPGAGSPCVRGRGLYLCAKFHLDPSDRLAKMHQRHRQTDRTDRQDNGPTASGESFYKRSPKNRTTKLHELFCTCGRGSIVLRRHYNISCISGSGFVNDVIFAHNRPSKGDANRMYTETDSPGVSTGGRSLMFAIALFFDGILYFKIGSDCLCAHLTLYPATDCTDNCPK